MNVVPQIGTLTIGSETVFGPQTLIAEPENRAYAYRIPVRIPKRHLRAFGNGQLETRFVSEDGVSFDTMFEGREPGTNYGVVHFYAE